MSVLIEGLTLVVRRSDLDERFPGGIAGFVEAAHGLAAPPRFVCDGNDDLVAAGFYGSRHLAPCAALLRDHGFAEHGCGGSAAFASVDQERGPAVPCPWLEWAIHGQGFTHAWLTGQEPGDLTVDDDWTPDRSLALVPRASVDEPQRLFRLAGANGLAAWLDLATGVELVGEDAPDAEPAQPAGEGHDSGYLGDAALEPLRSRIAVPGSEAATAGAANEQMELDGLGGEPDPDDEEHRAALRARIVEILEDEGLQYRESGPLWLDIPFTASTVLVTVRVAAGADGHMVRLYGLSDMRVPEEHRAAACEAVLRANYGLPVGNFEMDLGDGEVAFKGTIFLGDDGELGQGQLAAAIRGVVYVYDRYYPALMRVIYGGATPEEAIAEVEG